MATPDDPFIIYSMEDGTDIYGEYTFTTGLEWFDDRDEEVRLIKRTYKLVSEEVLVLPDPYPIEEDEDDDDTDTASV